jgi:hypothetical protein
MPFVVRLTRLTRSTPPPKNLPKAQRLAFLAEWHGDWAGVVKYQRIEIRLVELLRRLATTVEHPIARRAILRDFPAKALARLYDRLAMSQIKAGFLKGARASLAKSSQLYKQYQSPGDVKRRREILAALRARTRK